MYRKKTPLSLLFAILSLLFSPAYGQILSKPSLLFTSPKAGSESANPTSPVLIKYAASIHSSNFNLAQLYSIKAQGKLVPFGIKLIGNDLVQLIPTEPLPENTEIQVSQLQSLLLKNQVKCQAFDFSFRTTRNLTGSMVREFPLPKGTNQVAGMAKNIETAMPSVDLNDRLIKQIPFTISTNNLFGESRFYFLTTINYTGDKNRIQIMDETGRIRFERYTPSYALDFKRIGPGTFSYYDWKDTCYYVLNSSFIYIDTVKAGNGLITDNHELKLDPKTGNYWLLAQEVVEMDLGKTIPGASNRARVLDIVIQEITPNKEVVFEWRPRDYIPVEDAIGVDFFSPGIIDYIHSNAIDLDTDSTLLLCSRHLNEVERINRRTGELIWRLGNRVREKGFEFPNDPNAFSYQHDAQRLENGNILIFDNGNYRSGQRYSRVVEYALDEKNKIADLVWEYKNELGTISDFMGSAQRLSNGNTVIGWGGTVPTFTEVSPSGEKVFEASSPLWSLSYRAYHFDIRNEINRMAEPIALPGLVRFCNKTYQEIALNKRNTFNKYINPDLADSNWTVQMDNKQVVMATCSKEGVITYANTPLQFGSMKLAYKDTSVCSTSPKVYVPLQGDCVLDDVRWSNGSKEAYITLDPSIEGSRSIWVNYTSGEQVFSDTFKLKVTELPDFEIYGKRKFNDAWEIATYSAPYFPDYKYYWNVTNGHIISGFGTNAVQVQWGSLDSGAISVTLVNPINCEKTSNSQVRIPGQTNSLNEQDKNQGLSVYPNPAQNKLVVNASHITGIRLLDMSGRLVHDFQTELNKAGEQELNVESIAKGSYLLELSTLETKLTKRVILIP